MILNRSIQRKNLSIQKVQKVMNGTILILKAKLTEVVEINFLFYLSIYFKFFKSSIVSGSFLL